MSFYFLGFLTSRWAAHFIISTATGTIKLLLFMARRIFYLESYQFTVPVLKGNCEKVTAFAHSTRIGFTMERISYSVLNL